MKFLNFVKENIWPILVAIMLIVLLIWSADIISKRDAAAEILSEPLTENNEPETEAIEIEPMAKKEEHTVKTRKLHEVTTGPYRYFDIPLEKKLQDYIWKLCDEYQVPRTLVYAIIEQESYFDSGKIGDDGASYGLMQVQPYWHEDRMELFDCHDLLDPYQNVRVGIDYLAELIATGKSIDWVLMAYNGGPSYADEMRDAGTISEYAKQVLKNKDELRSVR